VSASCAVPGVMQPVAIDDRAYLDGGLVSPTNADVLATFPGGLIVVVSPMSGRRSSSTIGRVSSAHAQRRLSSEVRQLRGRQPVLVVEPNDALSAMVVGRALDTEHTATILTAAFLAGSGSLDAATRSRKVRQGSNGRRLG
jgi:NTE family protein